MIEISSHIEYAAEPGWDAFVASSPGGTHLQTTRWATLKNAFGWEPGYVIAREDGAIVGGCQLLLRRIPHLGTVSYVPRGPLAAAGRSDVAEAVTTTLIELMRSRRLLFVKLQPPEHQDDMVATLRDAGWREGDVTVAPDATTRVIVDRDDDELLRSLRSTTRRHIQAAQRAGGIVRQSGPDGIDTFTRIVDATGRRQNYAVYPAEYYRFMLTVFGEHARLLLAEYDGEAYAASLLIAFGDTVTLKMSGWSGERSELHASKLVHWEGFRLARELGCRYYDFDGISRQLAARILAGEEVISSQGVDFFKLGFRGEVVLLPPTLDRSYHPLGPGVQWLAPRVTRLPRLAQALLGLRSAASPG